ncbi:glycine--tRNA ligase subunit beta [Helicobacter cappadocius]|uniref:Glycine--tRNA ligase beta subunit n=1 Tax=Helicobacter cappadocius TaxID=3063998 RepID=A0AA90PVV3_9HELI|nr:MULTISPECIES: glycine--tRNA ligase subunit beta [unclassified Helicobacter]MDO7253277.1 glycine--tRNA ligase subunit beta [Helicobacter sp. faydin-H75]MDP2539200.1 glycine--tRNA ligase subunit beta [Helicobacter sp. faydin-H76]
MNTKDLLVEILVEELPAIPFLKELPNIAIKWGMVVQKYDLKTNPSIFYTPRRIVIIDDSFPTMTSSKKEEFFGPPISIAYIDGDKTKGLSKAGEGFCKKCQISAEEVQITSKDNKDILYCSKQTQAIPSKEILAKIIQEFIESLNFGKSMRWGSLSESFIRPIRNICILLGDEHIPIKAYGINGKLATKIHTDVSFDWIEISSVCQYLEVLKKGYVILSQKERREKILQEISQIEKEQNIQVEIDEDLLNEIISITEYPKALYGEFEERFLELPKEVIITSMKENQRYFATFAKNTLHNSFIAVSNATSSRSDQIILGNQKVLKARLSDAMFFYHNDLKNGLDSTKLEEIAFVQGLGSMADKVQRERKIAFYLFDKYKNFFPNPKTKELIQEAICLAKADLLTEMVYEFPELQGLMGYYYAKSEGKDSDVCVAIKEQYLPDGEDANLPSNIFSAIVALANKLDSIFALFSIGKLPTGSKDPFALRRASSGVIKIVLDKKLHFNLDIDLKNLFEIVGYKPFDIKIVQEFFIERLESIVAVNPSILRSVLCGFDRDVCVIVDKAKALDSFFEKSDKEAFVSTFKRVANITKDIKNIGDINEELFKLPEEIKLYKSYQAILSQKFDGIDEKIQALFSMKKPLDDFFDNVMVNDPDEKNRENRKNLIFSIYQKFLEVGDIKEIAF